MPIYEYRCDACSAVFSHFFRSIRAAGESAPPACPSCGHAKVSRLVSQVALLGDHPGAEHAEKVAATPEPSPLFGRKEIKERLRKERNRRSIARVSED